jgi:NADPH:quinone reductase-like Zn-dependent oxidoreductase
MSRGRLGQLHRCLPPGLYKVPSLPFLLGQEAAGTIEAVGAGVPGLVLADSIGHLPSATPAPAKPLLRLAVVPKAGDSSISSS